MNHSKKILITALVITLINCFTIYSQKKNAAYVNYVQSYNELAIIQQKEHGIPASITLAQGLLESGAGESDFVKRSNNHFGIKCHDWEGEMIYHDDDAKGECFRKYKTVLDSYEDHSAFLKNRSRYAFLFELSPTDYEQWAHGLKKAGYATDPSYAYKLISLIETYELHNYDLKGGNLAKTINIEKDTKKQKTKEPEYSGLSMGNIAAFQPHKIMNENRIRCVIANEGDTYGSIADEFNISEKRIRAYNEINESAKLNAGTKVYLQRKKNKSEGRYSTHTVSDGESMYSIAQNYGIKIKKLYDLNQMPYNQGVQEGQSLKLR